MRLSSARPAPAGGFDLTAVSTRRLLVLAALVSLGLWSLVIVATLI